MHSQGLMKSPKIVRTQASDSSKKKSKVVIIGNSHVRGYAAEIAHNLGKTFFLNIISNIWSWRV
jgi:hypothetical protein